MYMFNRVKNGEELLKTIIRHNPGISSRVLELRIVNTQINDIEIQTIYISVNSDASFISGILPSFLVPWSVLINTVITVL